MNHQNKKGTVINRSEVWKELEIIKSHAYPIKNQNSTPGKGFGTTGIDGYLYRSANKDKLEDILKNGFSSISGTGYPVVGGDSNFQVLFVFASAPLSALPVPGGKSSADCFVRFPISALPENMVYLDSHIGGAVVSSSPFNISGDIVEMVSSSEIRNLQGSYDEEGEKELLNIIGSSKENIDNYIKDKIEKRIEIDIPEDIFIFSRDKSQIADYAICAEIRKNIQDKLKINDIKIELRADSFEWDGEESIIKIEGMKVRDSGGIPLLIIDGMMKIESFDKENGLCIGYLLDYSSSLFDNIRKDVQ